MIEVDIAILDELFDLDLDTGELYFKPRLNRSFNAQWAGKRAGHVIHVQGKKPHRSCPYWYVNVRGRRLPAHRVVYAMINREWPSQLIDHKNGDTLDNRPDNIRAATPSQNRYNSRIQSNNTTGYKGVSVAVGRKKPYYARVNKSILGAFATLEEAVAARNAAAIRLHGEFYRAA